MAVITGTNSSVEGRLNTGYVAVNTFIHKRDIRKRVMPTYKEETLFDFLFYSDRRVVTDNFRFNWFEEDYLYSSGVLTGAPSATGAGVTTTVTLVAASHKEGGTLSPGRKGTQVMAGGVRGWVQSTDKTTDDAHTFTIKPARSTDDFGAAAPTTTPIYFFSSAFADGSLQPSSSVRKHNQYYNYTQIFKNMFDTDGGEATNAIEFNIRDPKGGQLKNYFYLQGAVDAAVKHRTDMDFAFILGVRSADVTDDDEASKIVYQTGGLENFIDDFGNTLTYTAGSLDMAKIDEILKLLETENAPAEVMFISGIDLNLEWDTLMKAENDNSGMRFDQFGAGSSQARAVEFGFASVHKGNHTIHKHPARFMNYNPVTVTDYAGTGFFIPLDKVSRRSASGGTESVDSIRLKFKSNGIHNRFEEHWTMGKEVTRRDAIEYHYLTETGPEFSQLNQYIKLEEA